MIKISHLFFVLFLISSINAYSIDNLEIPTTTTATVALNDGNSGPVDDECLKCICQQVTGCDLNYGYNGYTSGPFRITKPFWDEAGKPTLTPDSDPEGLNAFADCTTDYECAKRTVQGYMRNFQQDCDKDGVIDCYDFGAIHMLGRHNCDGYLLSYYATSYRECSKPKLALKV